MIIINTCYWELNPKELFKKNPCYQKFIAEDSSSYPLWLTELFDMYNTISAECFKIQKEINPSNFKEKVLETLEKEALLAEISFYLEKVDLSMLEPDELISTIKKEYLIDYYDKVGNSSKEGNFIISNLKEKVIEQRFSRFGKNDDICIEN